MNYVIKSLMETQTVELEGIPKSTRTSKCNLQK